jgi:hypothetical protein
MINNCNRVLAYILYLSFKGFFKKAKKNDTMGESVNIIA